MDFLKEFCVREPKRREITGRGRIRTYVGYTPAGLQPAPFGHLGTRPISEVLVLYMTQGL
jgi:hypothetical protein